MTTLFNFRNCYTVENRYHYPVDDYPLKELERVIGYYFTFSFPDGKFLRAVDFHNILTAGDNDEYSTEICVISDVYDFRKNDRMEDEIDGRLTYEEALELFMSTFAKFHYCLKVTHYDENGVGTII